MPERARTRLLALLLAELARRPGRVAPEPAPSRAASAAPAAAPEPVTEVAPVAGAGSPDAPAGPASPEGSAAPVAAAAPNSAADLDAVTAVADVRPSVGQASRRAWTAQATAAAAGFFDGATHVTPAFGGAFSFRLGRLALGARVLRGQAGAGFDRPGLRFWTLGPRVTVFREHFRSVELSLDLGVEAGRACVEGRADDVLAPGVHCTHAWGAVGSVAVALGRHRLQGLIALDVGAFRGVRSFLRLGGQRFALGAFHGPYLGGRVGLLFGSEGSA